jgi:hypothetical protein
MKETVLMIKNLKKYGRYNPNKAQQYRDDVATAEPA